MHLIGCLAGFFSQKDVTSGHFHLFRKVVDFEDTIVVQQYVCNFEYEK